MDFLQHRGHQLFLMFDCIIIAANKRHYDLRFVTQQLFKKLAGTDGTISRFEAHARLFFRSDTAKKLIQIMYHSHLMTPCLRLELLERLERLEQSSCIGSRGSSCSNSSSRSMFIAYHCINRPVTAFSRRPADS